MLRDQTKVALAPRARLALDRFIYDPNRTTGSIVLNLCSLGPTRSKVDVADGKDPWQRNFKFPRQGVLCPKQTDLNSRSMSLEVIVYF